MGLTPAEVGRLNGQDLRRMLDADERRHHRDVALATWVLSWIPDAVGAAIAAAFGDKGKAVKAYRRALDRGWRRYTRPRRRA